MRDTSARRTRAAVAEPAQVRRTGAGGLEVGTRARARRGGAASVRCAAADRAGVGERPARPRRSRAVADGLRVHDLLAEPVRAPAARAWGDAWTRHVSRSDPARLAVAEPFAHLVHTARYHVREPLAHLLPAVRRQEFLDGVEPSERPCHEGDPMTVIRRAVRCAKQPSPYFSRSSGVHRGMAGPDPRRAGHPGGRPHARPSLTPVRAPRPGPAR
ncbi:hypothetical protein [Streptomyces sp. NPDC050287]|uniref:hypothetical protein n=1 Tax=Streptomyces sp. NPDC050287 TaxID=3365608 RepID=UPI00379DCAF7